MRSFRLLRHLQTGELAQPMGMTATGAQELPENALLAGIADGLNLPIETGSGQFREILQPFLEVQFEGIQLAGLDGAGSVTWPSLAAVGIAIDGTAADPQGSSDGCLVLPLIQIVLYHNPFLLVEHSALLFCCKKRSIHHFHQVGHFRSC